MKHPRARLSTGWLLLVICAACGQAGSNAATQDSPVRLDGEVVECINAAFKRYHSSEGPKDLDSLKYVVVAVSREGDQVRVKIDINNRVVKATLGHTYMDGGAVYVVDPRTLQVVLRSYN